MGDVLKYIAEVIVGAGAIIAAICGIVNDCKVRNVKKTINESSNRAEMLAAKQRILQLISEDEIRMVRGKLPENKRLILEEFDLYKSKGGNSYISEKIEAYNADIDEFGKSERK